MNATRRLTGFAMVATLFLVAGNRAERIRASTGSGSGHRAAKGPKYTQAEYNAEQACAAEKTPAPCSSAWMILSRNIRIPICSPISIRFTTRHTARRRTTRR